jgi:hypothetical protein
LLRPWRVKLFKGFVPDAGSDGGMEIVAAALLAR